MKIGEFLKTYKLSKLTQVENLNVTMEVIEEGCQRFILLYGWAPPFFGVGI